MNTTHDVSHVTENASPTDTMNNFLFGEGSDQHANTATTVAAASEENGEEDEEDDEAAALAMALAMSVNLNSDGGDQGVEGQQSTENADDEEKSGEPHSPVAESDRKKEQEGADKAPHASEDENITSNHSMRIPILKDTINDGTIYSSIEGGVSCTLVHLVKLLASNTYAFKNLKMDPLSAVEKMRSLLAKVLHGEVYKKTSDSDKPMSSLLVEECITHLIQSTQQGKKATKVFESLHPYYQQSSYGGSVGFSEARALRVTFNLQCSTQGS